MWAIDDNPPPLPANDSCGKSFVDLLLKSSEEDMKGWPHRYYFECHKTIAHEIWFPVLEVISSSIKLTIA